MCPRDDAATPGIGLGVGKCEAEDRVVLGGRLVRLVARDEFQIGGNVEPIFSCQPSGLIGDRRILPRPFLHVGEFTDEVTTLTHANLKLRLRSRNGFCDALSLGHLGRH